MGLCVAFILGGLILALKLKLSFKGASYVMAAIAIASELCKIFTHMEESPGGGFVLGPEYLPFHLCSIMIFAVFYLAFGKEGRLCEVIKSLLVPVGLIGATFALIIPTSGVDFAKPFAYQCFVYHSGLIWYAAYIIATKKADLGVRAYRRNLGIMGVLVIVMLWINSALSYYETNFFFLVRPPMDGLPVLNLDNGWFAYFFVLVLIGAVLITLLHLPFIIKEKKAKAIDKN